jgi:hypothetical protein
MLTMRCAWVVALVVTCGCGGSAGDTPAVNAGADPGALVACKEFAPLAQRDEKEQLTNQQMLDGIRRVRDRAVAANPASDIARLSEQLVKTVSAGGSGDERRETFEQLKSACAQAATAK